MATEIILKIFDIIIHIFAAWQFARILTEAKAKRDVFKLTVRAISIIRRNYPNGNALDKAINEGGLGDESLEKYLQHPDEDEYYCRKIDLGLFTFVGKALLNFNERERMRIFIKADKEKENGRY